MKILSILGIVLLILLGTLLAIVLLVLFMPIVYRASGSAHAGEYQFRFRFRWLFGLARGEFSYPEGRALRIKALWITLFDSGAKRRNARNAEAATESEQEPEPAGEGETKAAESAQDAPSPPQDKPQEQEKKPEEAAPGEPLFTKLSGLKEKLQPYLAIVRDEDNQALTRHAAGRLGRILKSIRPRILRLEVLFGTGEPDTTGYAYGAFWAVKPFLGRKCRIAVTPDFERQILEGEVFLRGHVMAAVLLYHAVRVILDKRLWQLLDQLKKIQGHNNTDMGT